MEFQSIYKEYYQKILRYLNRTLNDRELAEDYTQEVFIRVNNGLDSFEGRSALSTWIYKIASNIANEQFGTFLVQYIPSVIINITNLYGPELGGKLISKINMAILSGTTGSMGFDSVFKPIVETVTVGTIDMLGLPADKATYDRVYNLLKDPFKEYAKALGIDSKVPVGKIALGQLGTISRLAGKHRNLYL